MKREDVKYQAFTKMLEEELIPAMGCTEPIALAYAASIARSYVDENPYKVIVEASGSIIKNVKSVIVPNTNHLKGIPSAIAAGIIAGNPDRELEVIADVSEEEIGDINDYLNHVDISVKHVDYGYGFDIIVTLFTEKETSKVRIVNYHTNVVLIQRNDEIILSKEITPLVTKKENRELLDIKSIYDYIETVEIEDIKEVLDRQIKYNMAIAKEGIENDYGANIGKVLLKTYGNDVSVRAKAYAAAGSDARMNGCELPVIINSGSGNQGITCSVPLVIYAKEEKVSDEKLYRALALSNLVAIHEKTQIGTLSAYCGAVSAAAGAGAGITYIKGGNYVDVIHTISNCLAIVSGIVCDGAKASCAAKIAASVDAAILSYHMYQNGQEFKGGDGIVMSDIESTIKNIGILGSEGMRETNEEIIKMMTKN